MKKTKRKKVSKEEKELKGILLDLRVIEKTLGELRLTATLTKPVSRKVIQANKLAAKLKERVKDILASLTPI